MNENWREFHFLSTNLISDNIKHFLSSIQDSRRLYTTTPRIFSLLIIPSKEKVKYFVLFGDT